MASLASRMTPEDLLALEEVKELADKVHSNGHFKTIVRSARPEMREGVYNLIKPFLKFTPVKFDTKWANE